MTTAHLIPGLALAGALLAPAMAGAQASYIDRALAKLSKIRDSVDVWWTGGAQTSQLLESGEVDMLPTWNGRAQTVIDAGGPVGIQPRPIPACASDKVSLAPA